MMEDQFESEELVEIERDLEFAIACPYLKVTVILNKDTWKNYICELYPEMIGARDLLIETLSKDCGDLQIFRKRRVPSEIAIYRRCNYFNPYNGYLRISLKYINEKKAILTTAHSEDSPSEEGMRRIR